MAEHSHFEVPRITYLFEVGTLIRAKDLRGLLRTRCAGRPGCLPWVLLHPTMNPAYHDAAGVHPVDAIVLGQIGEIPHEEGRSSEAAETIWLKRIADLLAYQFPDAGKTKASALVWGRFEPVAVVGIAAASSCPENQILADDYAHALFRIHQTECLRLEVAALRFVIANWRHPLMVVRGDGSIVTGSEAGWDALYAHLHRRPSRKNPVFQLPSQMAAALMSGGATFGEMTMTVSVLPDMNREIALPLSVVIMSKQAGDGAGMEERLRTLTQSQRAVYQRMVSGMRNKEIGVELGISIHTVVHHATAVLAKMGCQDRLQLMLNARSAPGKDLVAPPIINDASVIKPDLEVRDASKQAG